MQIRKEVITGLLLQKAILSQKQLDEILETQRNQAEKFSSLLLTRDFVKKEALIGLINENFKLSIMDSAQLAGVEINPEDAKLISNETALKYKIFPLQKENQNLTLALTGYFTLLDLGDINDITGYDLSLIIVPETELCKLIEKYYAQATVLPAQNEGSNLDGILDGFLGTGMLAAEAIKTDELVHISQEAPIVKATQLIIANAVQAKASDILIEPLENYTRVRFRIDGILHPVESLPKSFHPFIVSRVKVIGNLDIAEHRLPQDGQFKIKFKDKQVEFRVSIFPTTTGEKVSLRILDKSLGLLDIDKLCLNQEKLAKLKAASLLPHGMILVCGPTGSGKTTTLYSLLKFIHTPEKNIVTVEDPVEYQIKGINQVSVNPKVGLIFSRCLRSILRQDPDIIMIGEIRDFETMDIAIKAALTGHLVLSTLHTTTAPGSVIRLIDMGVEPFLINASIICIISQRLARRICPHCKEKVQGEPSFKAKGCKECMQTGYSGRVLIPEVLYITNEIKAVIASKDIDENTIRHLAISQGMTTLRKEGEALAREGITTLEEVYRVTPSE